MSVQSPKASTRGAKGAASSSPQEPKRLYRGHTPVTKAYFDQHEDFAAMANEEYEEMVAVEQATRQARRRIAARVAARQQQKQAGFEPSP